jgi:hypothetical protein
MSVQDTYHNISTCLIELKRIVNTALIVTTKSNRFDNFDNLFIKISLYHVREIFYKVLQRLRVTFIVIKYFWMQNQVLK